MQTTLKTEPYIHHADKLTAGMRPYWTKLAQRLAGQVDIIDPWRTKLVDLRAEYVPGCKVYRASTGGRWGKSAVIVTL